MEAIPTHFAAHVESLFVHALGPRIDASTRQEIRGLGIDLDRPLHPAYEQAAVDRALVCVIERCFSELAPEAAFREAGRLHILSMKKTLIGAAMVQLGRLLGPERSVPRLASRTRSVNNFTCIVPERLGPNEFILHTGIEPAFLPRMVMVPGMLVGPFLAGTFDGVLATCNATNPVVRYTILDLAKSRVDYHLTWDA
jgi:uncharacterized protein (TIGR02265 family)